MKKLIFFLALTAFGQGYVFNPFTNNLDKVGSSGGGSGASPYTATVTAQTTLTVTAATHGQGATPLVQPCLDGAASPRTGATCAFTVADNGDVVYTWSPAFTGKVVIGGGGVGPAGPAGPAGSYTIGTGLQQVGDELSIDTAVVPTKATANTFAELQTLQKGVNIASSTALATAGDLRYNGGIVQYRDGSGSQTLMNNPFTTRGDLVIQGASGPTRLAAGTSGYFLMANGAAADPSYQIPNASQITNAFDKSTGNTISAGVQDFSGTTFRVPNSTTLPATCSTGDSYMDTDATSGQRWYLCESANTWAVQGGAGGGSPGGSGTELQYRGGASTFSALANSSVPNAGELRISTTPASSGTRSVFGLGSAITGGSASGNYLTINSVTAFGGKFARFELDGSYRFDFASTGTFSASTSVVAGSTTLSTSALSAATNGTFSIVNGDSGSSAIMTVTGSAGTAATNYLSLRGTSGGSSPYQIRINGDQKAVMIGQTVNTTSLSSMSLYVEDDTATTGVTRVSIQEGAGQSTTNGLEYRTNNATANAGTLRWSIASGGIPTWGSTTEATCNSGTRGQVVMVQGGAGVADTLRVCRKDAADAYAWTALY